MNDSTGFVVGSNIYRYIPPKAIYPKIVPDTVNMCPGDSVTLLTEDSYEEYFWSTGETTQSITVKTAGDYYVKVVDKDCNEGKSNVTSVIIREEKVKIIPEQQAVFCNGDSVELTTEKKHNKVVWSNGSEDDTLFVSKPGKYYITAYNEYGCKARDSIDVIESDPKAEIQFTGNNIVCETDTFFLISVYDFPTYEWYSKPNDDLIGNSKSIRVSQSGIYYLIVRDKYGCISISDTIQIEMQTDSNRLEILSTMPKEEFIFDSTSFTSLSCRRFLIRNNSSQPYLLENVFLYKNIEFSAPQSQFPIIIDAYDTASVLLCFSPLQLGERRDTLLIKDVCDDWIVPLVANGRSNIYDGNSRCDVPVTIETTKLTGYLFEISKPVPNPAESSFRISFVKFIPNGMDFKENVALYDVLGNLCCVAQQIPKTEFSTKNGVHFSGDYLFDTRILPTGSYMLVIRSMNVTKTYPVIIKR